MMGHKAWYMDALGDWRFQGDITTNFTGFDDLACEFGVDLYLTGHVHLYQRFLPLLGPSRCNALAPPRVIDKDSVSEDGHTYLNPAQMATIVVASPGDQEITPHVACAGLDTVSAVHWKHAQKLCLAAYGYGHLQAVNSTHFYWEFLQTGKGPNIKDNKQVNPARPLEHTVTRDWLWLIQENHGPRAYCPSN